MRLLRPITRAWRNVFQETAYRLFYEAIAKKKPERGKERRSDKERVKVGKIVKLGVEFISKNFKGMGSITGTAIFFGMSLALPISITLEAWTERPQEAVGGYNLVWVSRYSYGIVARRGWWLFQNKGTITMWSHIEQRLCVITYLTLLLQNPKSAI